MVASDAARVAISYLSNSAEARPCREIVIEFSAQLFGSVQLLARRCHVNHCDISATRIPVVHTTAKPAAQDLDSSGTQAPYAQSFTGFD